jgi:dihydroxy-acid dehydratase
MKSDALKFGPEAAAHRSLYNALGWTEEEIRKPLVGIVSSYNEIVPGHMNIDKIVEAVKMGVAEAGGMPVVFPAIAVCDGIAMGHAGMKYSLVTRDLIADSTECMALAHGFDALVMVPNCDKNVPGLLMAAARLDLPTTFVSGGPMLAGHIDGHKTSLSSMFEAMGAYTAGKIDEDKLHEFECKACPTCGSCSGMYTANSMNCLTEVIGMGLRGNGTIPAVYSRRLQLAKHAGMAVMELLKKGITARQIMTKEALMNALTVDMALGCSTNTMLHLPAIAHECGVDLSLDIANEISARTPNLCHLAPAGPTYIEDLDEAGGIYAVMSELAEAGLIDTSCLTVTGKTVAENLEGARVLDHDVIRPLDNPFSKTGGIAVLHGNLAPEGSVVKRSAVAPEMLVHEGPARVFESEEEAQAAIDGGKINPGDVVVIRYEGPKGGPWHARDADADLCHPGHGPRLLCRPSSRMAASPAPPAVPASAMSRLRQPPADLSASSRKATSSRSISRTARSTSRFPMRSSRSAWQRSRPRRSRSLATSGATPSLSRAAPRVPSSTRKLW